jgi:hypothetical protein
MRASKKSASIEHRAFDLASVASAAKRERRYRVRSLRDHLSIVKASIHERAENPLQRHSYAVVAMNEQRNARRLARAPRAKIFWR